MDLPFWFSSNQQNYAVGVPALHSGDLSKRGYLFGAGMIVRRSVLQRCYDAGFVSLCSGRKQGQLLAGDDSDICKWFLLAGYRLWYEENLVFEHFMPENRLTKSYCGEQ